ncbi:hypothetical protein [Mocis latipes granulovirus]|uniref:Uncharacterized protein n=1 Tax=Mocis latipes granulovirus TaxID=2072024 RepID=A0A162GWR8_9BBAC|nr:hypothetical protein [Mocis latipes granulovirus]AKR17506.1 hypothetical protein [Mocis latipes granulovirus]
MSYKDLYQEIIRTQQDIAVTYQRLVAVENELKRNINDKNNLLPVGVAAKLDNLQNKVDYLLKQLIVNEPTEDKQTIVEEHELPSDEVDSTENLTQIVIN